MANQMSFLQNALGSERWRDLDLALNFAFSSWAFLGKSFNLSLNFSLIAQNLSHGAIVNDIIS